MTEAGAPTAIEIEEVVGPIDEWLEVRNAVDFEPVTKETLLLRASFQVATLRLLARIDGAPIGAASAGWEAFGAELGEALARVWVLPEARRRGAGSRLFERVAEFCRDAGIGRLMARVQADDAVSLAFARRRGFEVAGMQQLGSFRLDPTAPPDPPSLPARVRIVSLEERPALLRPAYALIAQVLPEVPAWGGEPVPSFESWSDQTNQPAYRKDLMLLALDGDEVIGTIEVVDDAEARLFISMLGVAPAWRRQGIARALKVELARRAADLGWQQILTVNDGTNERIRRLNEELGYRYLVETLLLKAPVPSA